MSAGFERRLFAVWLALSAITGLSWWIGARHDLEFALNPAITFGVILIAAIKVRVIMREFMEVRHAPDLLRRLTDMWLLFVVAALLGTYVLGLLGMV